MAAAQRGGPNAHVGGVPDLSVPNRGSELIWARTAVVQAVSLAGISGYKRPSPGFGEAPEFWGPATLKSFKPFAVTLYFLLRFVLLDSSLVGSGWLHPIH